MAVQLRRNTQLLEESALQAEIRRLKAELRQVTEERDILKEAACLSFWGLKPNGTKTYVSGKQMSKKSSTPIK
ncbi:hypothetical protein [Aeromonas sobria]|uniref:hypothetical protein n=1 Tax=Aeromonas sobria TaxID=646 RepID=UPI0011196A3D|nr:hypothetical protein [Aeromonas sobria]